VDISGFVDTLGQVAEGVGAASKIAQGISGLGKSGSQSTSGVTTLQAMEGEDDAALFQMFLDKYLEGIQQSYAQPVRPVI
tara:strand:- start:212 stop:451 length:240 start_codon:yes stop_codon:yes gene_type:complete